MLQEKFRQVPEECERGNCGQFLLRGASCRHITEVLRMANPATMCIIDYSTCRVSQSPPGLALIPSPASGSPKSILVCYGMCITPDRSTPSRHFARAAGQPAKSSATCHFRGHMARTHGEYTCRTACLVHQWRPSFTFPLGGIACSHFSHRGFR